jgi:hypothetical protein
MGMSTVQNSGAGATAQQGQQQQASSTIEGRQLLTTEPFLSTTICSSPEHASAQPDQPAPSHSTNGLSPANLPRLRSKLTQ